MLVSKRYSSRRASGVPGSLCHVPLDGGHQGRLRISDVAIKQFPGQVAHKWCHHIGVIRHGLLDALPSAMRLIMLGQVPMQQHIPYMNYRH